MTYSIVYPSRYLGDSGGDQFELKERMTYALQAHNYRNRNDDDYVPIDVSQMYSITRTKTKTPDIANNSWNRWRMTQMGQTYPKMSEKEKKYYRDKHYHKFYYSNIVVMKFENEQLYMPEFLQFQFYKCKVTAWDHGQNEIEKRIADLFQCHNCASAEH